jgi:[acyl-carrier-protein] S-malonyltransferase
MALERGLAPKVLLGHSLGEYAAWVAAGSLALDDALRLVRLRGRLMQEAVPVGVGAMSAVVGGQTAQIEEACQEAAARSGGLVVVAIHNCPGNLVISGHARAVQAAESLIEARQLGACKALAVSAPFHCPLLEPAARGLERALAEVEVRPNALPVIPNATGRAADPGQDPAQIRAWLVEQVVSPVLWEDSLRAALAMDVTSAVGLGPGTTARAHLKRVDRKLPLACLDEERPGL